MFGIYGINGPVFRGHLEELPAVRPVGRRRPIAPIETGGNELGDIDANPLPTTESAAVEAYRQVQRVDRERGPLVRARQIMRPEVITVRANDTVVHAWRTLTRERIHQAPVLDAGNALVGIVSERDLLTSLNLDGDQVRDALARSVADVMSSPVVAADPETDIRWIAQVMVEREVNGVPIVNERQRLIGFISRGDLLRAIVNDPPLDLWR